MTASSQTAGTTPTPVPLHQRPTTAPAPTPVQAAAGVIAEAMRDGSATPQGIAQAEEAAGLLFDPQRAEEIAAAAREQALADYAAEAQQLRERATTAEYFKLRYDRLQQLLLGRPDAHLLTVGEILAAIDGRDPRAGVPLTLTWTHRAVDAHTGAPFPGVAVDCTTAHGGRAVLVVKDDERTALAALLDDGGTPTAPCSTTGCGAPADTLDGSDPAVWGWSLLDVAGTEDGPRWYCTPACTTAALARAGAELAAVDQLAPGAPVDEDAAEAALPAGEGEGDQ